MLNPAADGTAFQVFARMRAWAKSEANAGETKMGIGGVVSTDGLDRQQERVLADGLDFSEFLSFGWFNDNHSPGTTDVLGYPTDVRRVRPGDELPDGTVCKAHGWWAEGYLLDTPKGRECWDIIHALQGTPRGIGFSIEGRVTARKGSGIVARASVRNVAITHVPVNAGTYAVALAKALSAGSAVASGDLATGAGDGGPLRAESLERDPKVQPPVVFDEAIEDPTLAKSVDQATGIPVVTEQHHVEDWAAALAYGLDHMGEPDDAVLTKSEARIVATSTLPHLRGPELDRLLSGVLR